MSKDRSEPRPKPVPDKFSFDFTQSVASQCWLCRHASTLGEAPACVAFPTALPWEISNNQVDHRRPWIDPATGEPGDTGISGARSITFEPVPDADPAVLARLYAHLDSLPR